MAAVHSSSAMVRRLATLACTAMVGEARGSHSIARGTWGLWSNWLPQQTIGGHGQFSQLYGPGKWHRLPRWALRLRSGGFAVQPVIRVQVVRDRVGLQTFHEGCLYVEKRSTSALWV